MAIQNWSERVLLAKPQNDPSFSEDLTDVLEIVRGNKDLSVVVDMKEVTHLGSSDLALLLRLRKVLLGHRQELLLCSVTTTAWSVFLATGLDFFFTFSTDVSTALATLQIDQDDE